VKEITYFKKRDVERSEIGELYVGEEVTLASNQYKLFCSIKQQQNDRKRSRRERRLRVIKEEDRVVRCEGNERRERRGKKVDQFCRGLGL